MLLQKPPHGAPASQRRGYLARLTVISTLGGLLFGYDTGVISGALLYMNDSLSMTSVEEAMVVSSLLFPGAAVGALTGGRMADRLGRRGSLLVCALLFLFGAIGCAVAASVPFMIAARILLGLGVGAAAVTCPLYLAEMAPAHLRGRMVTINELMIVTGQMLAFAINALLDALIQDPEVWRTMLGIASLPAVALLAGMLLLPESPRWYAIRGRLEDSRRVLSLSRSPEEAASEFHEIEQAALTAKEERGHAWRDLRDNPWMRRLLWIGIGLATVQQATGINTVNYYAPTILEKSGLGVSASLVATIGVGVTSVLMTILGIWLLGFVGRRKMLIIGFSGVVGSQALLTVVFLLPQSDLASYTILAAMMLFVAFVQCFIGTCVWLLLSEMFPLAIRGFAMGIAVFALWTVNAAISFLFPIVVESLGSTGTFSLFVLVNIASLAFVTKCVPETKGRSLEELESHFREGAIPARQPA
ncbi:major inositol transporter-like SP family MFS transporter [Pseudarthrobacter oxydans]|uniref:Major inositol transporter-like SP family MFS transporter n=1 Tax=Pseudarthrobacter oxydans TaxID=1671 RepID=A0AAW8N7Z1_PSEOX|nr:sugar porter family MFS transporter [Pseudarthrobacter oxydans]MDR6792897.1 major inositol transporter-like SP family MFS transporter [Pseudarthrobacter oxydans]MDR7163783.1 major inositol transporter-like SP family MFS transporter [Pseudarthrobacter oxydans]